MRQQARVEQHVHVALLRVAAAADLQRVVGRVEGAVHGGLAVHVARHLVLEGAVQQRLAGRGEQHRALRHLDDGERAQRRTDGICAHGEREGSGVVEERRLAEQTGLLAVEGGATHSGERGEEEHAGRRGGEGVERHDGDVLLGSGRVDGERRVERQAAAHRGRRGGLAEHDVVVEGETERGLVRERMDRFHLHHVQRRHRRGRGEQVDRLLHGVRGASDAGHVVRRARLQVGQHDLMLQHGL